MAALKKKEGREKEKNCVAKNKRKKCPNNLATLASPIFILPRGILGLTTLGYK
jgi:hypothetical protein